MEVTGGASAATSHENTITLPDTRVSRHHAQIQREGADYWLEDLGGANGTFINGQRAMGRLRLQHGDNIAIGSAQFYFVPDRPAGPDAEDAAYERDPPAPRSANRAKRWLRRGPSVRPSARQG